MTIDMHAHWKPAALIDALRQRKNEPRIVTNSDGVEVLKTRRGEQKLEDAFNNVADRLAEMDRFGITTGVLSLLGSFGWIERLPAEESLELTRLVNDGASEICRKPISISRRRNSTAPWICLALSARRCPVMPS